MSGRTAWLLDANLLVAMTHDHHVHHGDALAWFMAVPKRRWASCSLTQLAFIRLSCHPRIAGTVTVNPAEVVDALAKLAAHPQHEYWPDAPSPLDLPAYAHPAFVGHRQVTDLYLLSMAKARGQKLATLDRGIESFAAASGMGAHVELVARAPTVQEPRGRYVKR